MERKIKLEEILENWTSKATLTESGPWDWFLLVRSISDSQVFDLCGIDCAIYLSYLRSSGRLFAVLSVINLFLIVLYFTGDGETIVDHFILKSMVFNIQKSNVKLVISFLYA